MQAFASPEPAVAWLRERVTGKLCADSRRLAAGDGFLAWPGARFDAREHLASAWQRGALACLVEGSGLDTNAVADERVAAYSDLKAHSGQVASVYYREPSRQLRVLAVTGTNGKTSTAWWLSQALSSLPQAAAKACGLIGTLGVGYVPELHEQGLTTPDAVDLQTALARFVSDGARACAIEASSVGLEEHRLAGTHVHTAIFTNLTQDHLDYHGDMAHYGAAKAKLFAWPELKAAVINVDDPFGVALADQVRARTDDVDLWTVSASTQACAGARLIAGDVRFAQRGLSFAVREGDQQAQVQTDLIGQYNVSNLLGVIAALRTLGVSLNDAAQVCSALTPVPGRMQCVNAAGRPLVAVDYAHTPDALAQALQTLRPMAQQRGGRLWCVFGCGGDRDAAKRPLMGAVAARHADRVMLTSDNPRSESADVIVSQILLGTGGVPDVMVELERGAAIAQALERAAPQDVVLIAGKGHEDYQEIKGERRPFSDLTCVQALWGMAMSAGASS